MSSSSDETSFSDDEESHANPFKSGEDEHEDADEHDEDDSDDDEESEVKKPRIRTNLSRKRQAITFSIVIHVKQAERTKGSTPIPFSTQAHDQQVLQNLDLQSATVIEMLTAIQSDIIDSDFFHSKIR